MTRTKWMRLVVRDPADVLRWASQQDARQLDAFRYRVIAGREFVSFRLVPRYPIQIGTSDIIVVAHVKPRRRQVLTAAVTALWRRTQQCVVQAAASLKPTTPADTPLPTAALYQFAAPRLSSRG